MNGYDGSGNWENYTPEDGSFYRSFRDNTPAFSSSQGGRRPNPGKGSQIQNINRHLNSIDKEIDLLYSRVNNSSDSIKGLSGEFKTIEKNMGSLKGSVDALAHQTGEDFSKVYSILENHKEDLSYLKTQVYNNTNAIRRTESRAQANTTAIGCGIFITAGVVSLGTGAAAYISVKESTDNKILMGRVPNLEAKIMSDNAFDECFNPAIEPLREEFNNPDTPVPRRQELSDQAFELEARCLDISEQIYQEKAFEPDKPWDYVAAQTVLPLMGGAFLAAIAIPYVLKVISNIIRNR